MIIGTLPKYPLLRPRASEKMTDHASLVSIGRLRGAAHNIISGTSSSLAMEQATSRPRGQSYWTDAMIYHIHNVSREMHHYYYDDYGSTECLCYYACAEGQTSLARFVVDCCGFSGGDTLGQGAQNVA